jgi:hypothetical protein
MRFHFPVVGSIASFFQSWSDSEVPNVAQSQPRPAITVQPVQIAPSVPDWCSAGAPPSDEEGAQTNAADRSRLSAANENRHRAERYHLHCLAAEQQLREAAAPMRGHNDEVTAVILGCSEDAFGRKLILHVYRGAREIHFLGSLGHGGEDLSSSVYRAPVVLCRRERQNHLRWDSRCPRLRHSDNCHLALRTLASSKPCAEARAASSDPSVAMRICLNMMLFLASAQTPEDPL